MSCNKPKSLRGVVPECGNGNLSTDGTVSWDHQNEGIAKKRGLSWDLVEMRFTYPPNKGVVHSRASENDLRNSQKMRGLSEWCIKSVERLKELVMWWK